MRVCVCVFVYNERYWIRHLENPLPLRELIWKIASVKRLIEVAVAVKWDNTGRHLQQDKAGCMPTHDWYLWFVRHEWLLCDLLYMSSLYCTCIILKFWWQSRAPRSTGRYLLWRLFFSGCLMEKKKPLKESKLSLGALLKPAAAARWHGVSVEGSLGDGLCPFPQSPETGHLLSWLSCGQRIMTSLRVLVSVSPLRGDGFWVWGAGRGW